LPATVLAQLQQSGMLQHELCCNLHQICKRQDFSRFPGNTNNSNDLKTNRNGNVNTVANSRTLLCIMSINRLGLTLIDDAVVYRFIHHLQ
jgi:hypothetical protein